MAIRVLKYAILGLLSRRPMTGYDLWKEFDYELAEFWHAKHSQIYTELKKLHDEGDVTFDIEISGDVLEKKQYQLTEKGKEEFLNWLDTEEPIARTAKDVFRVRMYFCNNLPLSERIHLLEHQKAQHEKRLNTLKTTFKQYEGQDVPDYQSDRFGDFILLESAIIREEGIIKWMNRCIDYCQAASKQESIG